MVVVAADWLVKAEHDTEARPILVSTSQELIDEVGDQTTEEPVYPRHRTAIASPPVWAQRLCGPSPPLMLS